MRKNGLENDFSGVKLEGGDRIFREKFISDRIFDFIKAPTSIKKGGLLWNGKGIIDEKELVRLAKIAQSEVANEEFGVESVKLTEFVMYERIPQEGMTALKESEVPVEEVIEEAEAADEVRAEKREVRDEAISEEEEEKEFGKLDDMEEMEGFDFEEEKIEEEAVEETEQD